MPYFYVECTRYPGVITSDLIINIAEWWGKVGVSWGEDGEKEGVIDGVGRGMIVENYLRIILFLNLWESIS
jgi:hypothetical protein